MKHALQCGAEIIAHRRSESSTPVIELPDEVRWITKALEEIDQNDMVGCNSVVHFAATGVTPKPATWQECFRFNTLVSMNLLETAKAAGVARFVAAGSYAEYGRAGLRFDPIPPDAPLEPTDPYAASKAASCIGMAAFARANKMEFYYGRVFSAYGEGQSEPNFWPQLRMSALSGEDFAMTKGEQVRDFIPVGNVAEAFYQACERNDMVAGEPMMRNVASGCPVTLRDFAEQKWQEWNATGKILAGQIEYRPNEVMRFVPLVTK